MLFFRAETLGFLFLTAALAGACGGPTDARSPTEASQTDSGGGVLPASEAERQVLQALERLPNDKQQTVGGLVVTAGTPYHSASGRTCRRVLLKEPSGALADKLACKAEPDSWVFVPSVFAPAQGG